MKENGIAPSTPRHFSPHSNLLWQKGDHKPASSSKKLNSHNSHGKHSSSLQTLARRLQDACTNTIRVTICSWAAILHVAFSSLLCGARDANGCATIGNRVLEILDAASFTFPSETLLVAFPVFCNVLFRLARLAKSLTDLLDHFVASRLSHAFDGEVGVASSTVPISIHGLRLE